MKKSIFLGLLLAIVGIMAAGCESCQSENKKQDSVRVDTLNVEQCISLDRETMFTTIQSGDYRWFETTVKIDKFLDEDLTDAKVIEVSNIFQYADTSKDTKVQFIIHTLDGTQMPDPVSGFWTEDLPLDNDTIILNFMQALERLKAADITKPHSQYCVLRKPLGPVLCKPQYVFGNMSEQVYVDAVSGDVSAENPAFKGFTGMPLGEWP